uniref:Uncharacterized protein LOC105115534 isoform X2 n=1 Tax=Rhizophora mucronata TaxID=61149 RepID=A0A2P2K7V9_RHIMU
MAQVAPRDGDFGVDLESGLRVNVEDSGKEPILGTKIPVKPSLSKACGALVDGKTKVDEELNLCGDVPKLNGVPMEQAKSKGEKTADHTEKRVVKEKGKKTSNKKPPRPPRAPSLDSADQKLLKEVSELAILKRARIERMKALKKMKAAKASSSSSSLFAMVFTILFCLVIFLQGDI